MIDPKILSDYAEQVYGYAFRRTYTRDEADDLSQEILLTVLRQLPKLRDENSFEPFLWGIAENVLKTFRRCQGRQRAMFVYDMPEELAVFDEYTVEQEDTADRLRTQIAMLSKLYRDIIILYYYDNLPVKEIARRLGIPEGTVTWRLSAGREKLKKESVSNMNASALRPIDNLWIDIYGSGEYDNKTGKPFPNVYIGDALSKQIIWNCRETPCTVETLANALGVPAYYIEDSIRNLVERNALIKMPQGKYISDMIIMTDQVREYELSGAKLLEPIADRMIEALENVADEVYALGHYTAAKPKEQLIYAYSILATQMAFSACAVEYPEIKPNYDGYCWRYIVSAETGKVRAANMGFHGVGEFSSSIQWRNWRINGLFDFGIMPKASWLDVCKELTLGLEPTNSESFAKAVEFGCIRKDETGKNYSNIPLLTREERERFDEIANRALGPLKTEVAEIGRKYAEGYINMFPKHLADDAARFAHNFTSGSMLPYIFERAIERGIMTTPPKEDFYCEIMWET